MKKYVEVIAQYDTQGNITPQTVIWDDGRKFHIDRVVDVRRASSLKNGGLGTRYTVRIGNKTTYLWFEDPMWAVEVNPIL